MTSISTGYTAAYDAAGNMLCRAPTSSQTCSGSQSGWTGQSLGYDNEGRLATWVNSTSSPTITDTFLYDGEGHRIEQVVQSSTSTTDTVYVGGLEEVTTTTPTGGQPTTSTLAYYGGVALAVNGTLSYLGSDSLGSAEVALTPDGHAQASQLFTPYGTGRYSSGAFPTDIGFTGYHTDATTGLDYANSRYYDPAAGQFSSADTTEAGGLNLYGYVGGSPETFTDPSGHEIIQADPAPPQGPGPELGLNWGPIIGPLIGFLITLAVVMAGASITLTGPFLYQTPTKPVPTVTPSTPTGSVDYNLGRAALVQHCEQGGCVNPDAQPTPTTSTGCTSSCGCGSDCVNPTGSPVTTPVSEPEPETEPVPDANGAPNGGGGNGCVPGGGSGGGDNGGGSNFNPRGRIRIRLWRAVLLPELESIRATGAFSNPPGIDEKYFSFSPEGAISYAQAAFARWPEEGAYWLTSGDFPVESIPEDMMVSVDRGISTVTLSTKLLPLFRDVRIGKCVAH